MSVAAMLTGRRFLSSRHRDRLESQRVANHADDEEEEAAANDGEEGSFINDNSNNNTIAAARASEDASPNEPAGDIEEGGGDRGSNPEAANNDEGTAQEEEGAEGIHRFAVRPTMTLAELEEERELARRRSSACILFALFVLFRLWILALSDGDFGLLLLCLVGTSWTARWIRYNRDQEEELDRRIASYLENNNNENGGNRNEVGREDMRMLSFQAQLALAIMESQRQMMQGGYGNPDGENQTPGVSEEAKAATWKKFSYKAARDKTESRRGSYGSVAQQEDPLKGGLDEEPHCSICLGEYEEGEDLVKLPCSHIYHGECIDSWCSNHVRCPLCNYDLVQDTEAAETV